MADLTDACLGLELPDWAERRVRGCAWRRLLDFLELYEDAHDANYEDLAFALRQIADLETGEQENPAADALLSALARESRLPEHDVAQAACSLHAKIRDEVCERLGAPSDLSDVTYPGAILRPLQDRLAAFVTLNHDMLVERSLPRFDDHYADGFSLSTDGRMGTWASAFDADARIPFVKLHGSVNWRRLNDGDEFGLRTVGTSRVGTWDASRIATDLGLTVGEQAVLVGTFNKAHDYHVGIFGDLYWWFEALLRRGKRLLVLGYGFGDQAVNASLVRWMDRSEEHTLLLVDVCPDEMLGRARPAIRRRFPVWKARRRASVLHGSVSDQEIVDGLDF